MNIRKCVSIFGVMSLFIFNFAEYSYASSNIANVNPDPISRYLVWDAPSMQNRLFDNADSVWIGVMNLNLPSSSPSFVEPMYACPRDIGHIAINRIAKIVKEKWMLLHFVSTSGVTGTFNLQTHQWRFSLVKGKSTFVNIDPIQPLHLIMPDRFIEIGTTGAWIDGDWHSRNRGFGARYISTYTNPHSETSYIRVVDMNRVKMIHQGVGQGYDICFQWEFA